MGILIADGGIRITNGLRNVKPQLCFCINVISPTVLHCVQFAGNACQLLKMVTSGNSHSSKSYPLILCNLPKREGEKNVNFLITLLKFPA
jgi:hypothetical protein